MKINGGELDKRNEGIIRNVESGYSMGYYWKNDAVDEPWGRSDCREEKHGVMII